MGMVKWIFSWEVNLKDNMEKYRQTFMDKKRIVIKIGSSSLTHPETGKINFIKM